MNHDSGDAAIFASDTPVNPNMWVSVDAGLLTC